MGWRDGEGYEEVIGDDMEGERERPLLPPSLILDITLFCVYA